MERQEAAAVFNEAKASGMFPRVHAVMYYDKATGTSKYAVEGSWRRVGAISFFSPREWAAFLTGWERCASSRRARGRREGEVPRA